MDLKGTNWGLLGCSVSRPREAEGCARSISCWGSCSDLPWLGERATQLVWDCPVPGGCILKRPDMLSASRTASCRSLRLNPDAERVASESGFCVGDANAFNALFDAAEAAVEAFVGEPAPEGVRVVGLPASWWGQ